jgi:apolipoprotein N-acyltransferase
MTRRRKRKTAGDGDDAPPAPAPVIVIGRLRIPTLVVAMLGPLLSAGLLTLSFTPFDLWPLAYVAIVPWALSLALPVCRRWAVLFSWAGGAIFWLGNLYWLTWITLVGYFSLTFYLSLYWLATAVLMRAALRRNWPMWIVLPLFWVALEYARAYVISGFPWFYLAQTQWSNIALLQVCDLVGQYGVSFFVAMINGVLVDLLRGPLPRLRRPRSGPKRRVWIGAGASCVVLIGMLSYGWFRLAQTPKVTTPGPRMGVVQQAFPVSLQGFNAPWVEVFEAHYRSSFAFAGTELDLLVWPETMLPRGLNPELLTLDIDALTDAEVYGIGLRIYGPGVREHEPAEVRAALRHLLATSDRNEASLQAYARRMGELSRRLDCAVLAGGSTLHRDPYATGEARSWVKSNSALWFDGSWRAAAIYSKEHLVPFSEYVPFRRSWPPLHRTLRRFVPPAMDQLEPGKTGSPFELAHQGRTVRLGAPICYEGTFARVCRGIVVRDGRKRGDILVNLSNDGWFVREVDGVYRGSTEHPQHLIHYVFRAIENRTPVVRAVNTGISASIDSCGRIVAQIREDQGRRTMIAGRLLLADGPVEGENLQQAPQVLVDGRTSVYSLTGDLFALAVSISAVVLAGVLVGRVRKRRTQRVPEKKDKA